MSTATAEAKPKYETLECDAVIRLSHKIARDLPQQYRRCSYCGGKLAIHFEAWTKQDDGTWVAEWAKADCLTEPSERSRKFEDWINQHCYMPYVYWLPLEQALTRWVNKHYRFNIRDRHGYAEEQEMSVFQE